MVFYKLRVGNYEVRYTPLKLTAKDFPYCDSEGNILNKIELHTPRPKTEYVNLTTGEKHTEVFRLINGLARAKISKTKEVNNFLQVNKNEVEDLLIEKVYVVDSPLLLEKLQQEKKAFKFAFSNGNGFKVYLAYIHTSELYKNVLFMSLGQAQKSTLIKEVLEQIQNSKAQRETEMIISGVNKATCEELLELTA
jgi:hypothetical protein